ncbi:tetratricopeptide repeat protein [Thalassotalea montiporae]
MRSLAVLIFVFMVVGCSNHYGGQANQVNQKNAAQALPIAYHLFNPQTVDITSEKALFSLSAAQQQQFLDYYNKALAHGDDKHKIISDYLLSKLSNFTYYGETHTASQAMASLEGNCMSLAILTTALARLVGVDLAFREVLTLPVFEKQNNLVLSSIHVQTKLFAAPSEGSLSSIFANAGVVIDYFPDSSNIKSRYLKYHQFVAMYYKNIATDALVAGDLETAFANAITAYQYDPASVEVMNLLAVVHRRKGDEYTAEQIYKYAMKRAPNNLSLLSNYATLLSMQQRTKEANRLQEKMAKLEDPNPYSWLDQAYLAQQQGNHQQAIAFFNRTIELAPYVNQAYVGLYQVHMAKGHEARAKNAIAKALDWTYEQSERRQLKYKLYGRNKASGINQ